MSGQNESLIIDVRQSLPWHKRYFSNTSTVALWVCWLLLWQPIMNAVGLLDTQSDGLVDRIMHAFYGVLEHGCIALAISAVMLWLWSRYVPAKAITQYPEKSVQDYAAAFHLSEQEIQTARQHKNVTVFHDEKGRITKIQSN